MNGTDRYMDGIRPVAECHNGTGALELRLTLTEPDLCADLVKRQGNYRLDTPKRIRCHIATVLISRFKSS